MAGSSLTGTCSALYCLDLGRGIDLQRAEASLHASRRSAFHHKKSRTPEGAGMARPVRVLWKTDPQTVGRHATRDEVEISIYDLGALGITWNVPLEGELDDLVELSAHLYDNAGLIARSRELAKEVMSALGPALLRPRLSEHIEDYIVFSLSPFEGGPAALLRDAPATLARILRAEEQELSEQEVVNALSGPVSYGAEDVCLVDWLTAILVGSDPADERFVLELATVELLELRLLDNQLEGEIQEAYELLAARRGPLSALTVQRRELEHVARAQADDALLHEGVDNALKLFGDDYLARLYQTASERFHFEDWDVSIQRKLGVLRTVYQSMADLAGHRRAELLEWIIILLIAVDIVLYFTPLR